MWFDLDQISTAVHVIRNLTLLFSERNPSVDNLLKRLLKLEIFVPTGNNVRFLSSSFFFFCILFYWKTLGLDIDMHICQLTKKQDIAPWHTAITSQPTWPDGFSPSAPVLETTRQSNVSGLLWWHKWDHSTIQCRWFVVVADLWIE